LKTFELTEFRDSKRLRTIEKAIKRLVERIGRVVNIMEFCGGHTHAIVKHGIDQLLEGYVRFVHGPGCPVCVIPQSRIDLAIHIARQENTVLCSYGDLLRVPGSQRKSLLDLRAEGREVRMVNSSLEVLKIAQAESKKNVVFFAIGFETTTPQTAVLLLKAKQLGLRNLYVVSNHVVTPSAIQHILNSPEIRDIGKVSIDAFIGPGHVSTIIGVRPYEYFSEEFLKPVAICGFEPLDVMQGVWILVKQIAKGEAYVANQYTRFVTYEGNLKAQKLVSKVFELRKEFEWRGLGIVPYSALKLRDEFEEFDGEKRFYINLPRPKEHPACICGKIIRGVALPTECKLFGTVCTPQNPIGSCMVSSEGACNAYYRYKRL